MDTRLNWPLEAAKQDDSERFLWNQAGSNLCLDFHGDPLSARLVVFSDGNHHMALEASCQYFLKQNPDINDIFYATTPPRVISESLLQGGVTLGNLTINIKPHVFISPEPILDKLVDNELMTSHQAFARSRCNVLLIKKGNPKNIRGIADFLRDDVKLTLSNPVTEGASHMVYRETILTMAQEQNLNVTAFENLLDKDSNKTLYGDNIHHREVPQAIFSGQADVAVVYYHLALRYATIFPENFEFIELDTNNNVQTDYHIGLIGDGGEWGQQFLEFVLSENAMNIYKKHGLTNC